MHRLIRHLRKTFARFREHEGPRVAAAIAFYVLFSAVPAVAFLVASVGWAIRDPHEQAHVLGHMLEVIPTGSTQNRTFLMNSVRAIRDASGGMSVVGAIGLAWSGLGMFSAARWGLNRAWGVRSRSGFVRVRLLDLAAALVIWILLFVSAVATAGIHILTRETQAWSGGGLLGPGLMWGAAQWSIPAVLSFAAFLFLYRYVPNVTHRIRDVLPAAMIATAFFELTKYLFALYVSLMTSRSSLFSALGGILGFMLWIYLCAVILLWGAEFAFIYAAARNRESEPFA